MNPLAMRIMRYGAALVLSLTLYCSNDCSGQAKEPKAESDAGQREDFYEAWESVLNAIAHYWAATSETYVTIVGSASGGAGTQVDEEPDLMVLADRIRFGSDPFARFIRTKLPGEILQRIDKWEDRSGRLEELKRQGYESWEAPWKKDLKEAMDGLIRKETFWEFSRFQGLDIPEATRLLAASNPKGEDLVRANRKLLGAAYQTPRAHEPVGALLQVKFMELGRMWPIARSKADELNGIAFRGRVSLRFAVYRAWDADGRTWTKWQDVRPHEGDGRPTEIARNMMGPLYPGAFRDWGLGVVDAGLDDAPGVALWRNRTALDFRVEKREGKWFVEAVHGPSGSGAPGTEGYWRLIPYATFVNRKQWEEDPQKAVRPGRALLTAINTAEPARVAEALRGTGGRDTPNDVAEDISTTMDALRGRKLGQSVER